MTKVDLSYNKISGSGMVPLSDALKVGYALFLEISSFAALALPVTQKHGGHLLHM